MRCDIINCGTRRRRIRRHGILFTFDALLASLLLFGALLVILQYARSPPPALQTSHYAQDALLALSTISVGELEDPFVEALIGNGTIEDPDATVLETIGMLWATNQTMLAENLSRVALESLLPADLGIAFNVGDDWLFVQNRTEMLQRAAARRMMTGIQEGGALEGSTSAAYLKRIKDKESFIIAYLGGFVGQGNLTVQLGPVPDDISAAAITDITVQLDTVEDFSLLINGAPCMTLTSDSTLMTTQSWNATMCKGNLTTGYNNITFIPLGDLADAYLAGGFIKVLYVTDDFQEDSSSGMTRYNFPVIDGIINLYDSVYAPGYVTDWYLNISFYSNYTIFMRLGNDTIFSSEGSNATQTMVLEAHNLTWAPITMPLRVGTTNFSNVTFVLSGQASDTVLVTDVSGSMDDCGEMYTGMTCKYKCSWWFWSFWMQCVYPGSCSDEECGDCGVGWSDGTYSTPVDTICNRTKLEIAKSADKAAVDIILNVSGNHAGLVSYSSQVGTTMALTTDNNALNTQIDGYTANGGTCICCGINRAKNMLTASANKQYMIVMSDGDANYACDSFDDYTGTSSTVNLASNWTIDAGQNACNNYNITVYTIAFGTALSQQGIYTLNHTACNSSLFYMVFNASELEAIYRNITNQTNLNANFTAQTLVINGTYLVSHLYAGSYLDLNYTPLVDSPGQSEILVKFETPQFANCTTTLDVPPGLRLSEAIVTSYSGPYWTSWLEVNGLEVFNLSQYSTDYVAVGDPFLVTIPVDVLNASSNTIRLVIADNDQNTTNCSANNTIFYQGYINSSIPRSTVLSESEGCHWQLEFEDGHFLNVTIPSTYTGVKNCTYTNASHDENSYNPEDSYDYGVYHLMYQLDFDGDGRVFVNINAEDLEIIVTIVSRVPYLWGPTMMMLEVWR